MLHDRLEGVFWRGSEREGGLGSRLMALEGLNSEGSGDDEWDALLYK